MAAEVEDAHEGPELVPLRELAHRAHVVGVDLWRLSGVTDDEVALNTASVTLLEIKQVAWALEAHVNMLRADTED